MATAAVNQAGAKLLGIAAAVVMVAVIGGISFTGHWPSQSRLSHVAGKGILDMPADRISRVEITMGDNDIAFARAGASAWTLDGTSIPPAVSGHVSEAVRLLAGSPPKRVLGAGEYDADKIAEFGLDPPRMLVSLFSGKAKAQTFALGEATASANSQYVRIVGQPAVYLLADYVGGELRLAVEMAERAGAAGAAPGHPTNSFVGTPPLAGRANVLFLPLSFANIWAVEIVENGTFTRFERDPAGAWFHHVGQHTHKFGFVHKADPKFAPLIAAEFTGLERASVETVVTSHPNADQLAQFGLEHPPAIMMLYTRDSFGAVARVEFGGRTPDGFGRYARVRETDSLVTVPRYVPAHVDKLLDIARISAGSLIGPKP